jgi:hypothetical protein
MSFGYRSRLEVNNTRLSVVRRTLANLVTRMAELVELRNRVRWAELSARRPRRTNLFEHERAFRKRPPELAPINVLRPILKRIEGDNADRVIELPRHQIGDGCFEVRPLDVGHTVCGAKPAKAVDDELDRLIRAVGHYRHD